MAGGGSERVFAHLLGHLDRQRFAPSLALLSRQGPFLASIPEDVEVVDLGARRARYAMRPLVSLVRRLRPDIVFSTLGHMNLAVMLCKPIMPRRTRFIARESIVPSVELAHGQAPFFFPFLYRRLYPLFDRVVCQSLDMQNDLTETLGVPRERTVLIHNPVDLVRIEESLAGAVCPLPTGVLNVVAMGRLDSQKGFDMLLRAFSLLQGADCRLTILGEGPERERLEAMTRELGIAGRVTFAGFQVEPHPYLAHADVFVLSSRYEGFPNVVLEAMACGTPVAAFACPGGLNELVQPGVNGCLAPVGDVGALAACIAQLLESGPCRKAVHESVATRFALPRIVREYEAVFEAV